MKYLNNCWKIIVNCNRSGMHFFAIGVLTICTLVVYLKPVTVNADTTDKTQTVQTSSSMNQASSQDMNKSASTQVSIQTQTQTSADTQSATQTQTQTQTQMQTQTSKNQSSTTPTPSEPVKNGLVTENGNLYYYINNVKQTGLKTINQKMYNFSSNGQALKGLFKINGELMFFQNDYVAVLNKYQAINNKTYYFNGQGQAVSDFQTINNNLQYFDPTTKVQSRGTYVTSGYNHWYYLNPSNGNAVTGFQTIKGELQYFDPQTKRQAKGKYVTSGKNRWFYMSDYDGSAVSGFQWIKGKLQYYDPKTKIQAKGTFKTNGGNRWFYLSDYDGSALKGFQWIKSKYYYFDKTSCVQYKGRYASNGGNRWFYFSTYDGTAVTGLQDINGRLQIFDGNHVQVKNGWRNLKYGSAFFSAYDGTMSNIDLNHRWYSQLKQGAPEGCEGAAMQICLSIRGRSTSLQDVYKRTGYGFYGNPGTNFYGNPWGGGVQNVQTVFASRLANTTGMVNLTGAHGKDIIWNLQHGYGVITYGTINWQLNGAFHVMAIVGYKPGYFKISDPYANSVKEYWLSTSQWENVNANAKAWPWGTPSRMNVSVR